VILEIGCGDRVPTVRYETEAIAGQFMDQTTLIRFVFYSLFN